MGPAIPAFSPLGGSQPSSFSANSPRLAYCGGIASIPELSVYTVRTFPENLLTPKGSRAYSEWTGGWLGVLGKQTEDFTDFHKKWYLEDVMK
jgi:hypothetical protein